MLYSAVEDDLACHTKGAAPKRPVILAMMAMRKLQVATTTPEEPTKTPRNTETTPSITVWTSCEPNIGISAEYAGIVDTDGGKDL